MPTVVKPLTTSQAARVLGLSAQRVRQLVDEGKLQATVTPLGRLLDAESVLKLYTERQEAKPA